MEEAQHGKSLGPWRMYVAEPSCPPTYTWFFNNKKETFIV